MGGLLWLRVGTSTGHLAVISQAVLMLPVGFRFDYEQATLQEIADGAETAGDSTRALCRISKSSIVHQIRRCPTYIALQYCT